MKTKPIPILLGIALPILAFASTEGNKRPLSTMKTFTPAGAIPVDWNPKNPRGIVGLLNPSGIYANDLHFKLIPSTPGLKSGELLDPKGKPLAGWSKPKKEKRGEYSMKMGPGGTPMPPTSKDKAWGGLRLVSKGTTGWNRVELTWTLDGDTLFPPTMAADAPTILKTGNRFPVNLRVRTNFTNGGTFAISQIQLSVDTNQSFVEIGSDRPGFGIPTDGVYVFEEPILPGESAVLWWVYDAFSSNPDQDTEVTITPITEAQVLMVQSSTSTQTTSKQSRTRKPVQLPSWKANTGNVLLPKMKIVVLDPKLKRAVLLSRGKFQFEAKGAVLRLLKGKAKVGKPFVGTSGALVIPYEGGKTPFTLELSGVVAKFGTNTKKGIVRVFLKGKHSEMRVPVGFRR